jgi:hypothetical protein
VIGEWPYRRFVCILATLRSCSECIELEIPEKEKIPHVAVENECLARAELEIVEFVSGNENVLKRCRFVSENGNSMCVPAVVDIEAGFDFVNSIVDQPMWVDAPSTRIQIGTRWRCAVL